MKILAVLLLAVVAYQAPQTGAKNSSQNEAGDSAHCTATCDCKPKDPIAVDKIDSPAPCHADGQQKTATAPDPAPKWWEYVNAGSTAVIAVFTILLFFGVLAQINASRTIERAWIMAELRCSPSRPS